MASTTPSHIPQIHLLCMDIDFAETFEEMSKKYHLPSSVSYQVHNCRLSALSHLIGFDTIVSPANSYGRLDGAFDDAISRALSPEDDYLGLTHVVQKVLYEKYRGFAPPGTCTLVRIPDEFEEHSLNVWGVCRVALCPTMRLPADARWDREVVYECIWNLLCAISNHNRDVKAGKAPEGEEEIKDVLMTPLATGVGHVSAERWAAQTVLAMKHFVEASEEPEKWQALEWHDFGKHCAEVQLTWNL